MWRLRAAALLILLALCGCGATLGAAPPSRPAADAVTQRAVQNGRFIELIGPHHQFAAPFLGVPDTNYDALRSLIDTRNGDRSTQLYVEASYAGDERTYRAARTADGQAVKFVSVSRSMILCQPGCSYAEEFAADLPEPLLRAHPQGLTLVFSAKAGPELTIAVAGELIAKQLAAIAAARAALPAASACPPHPGPLPARGERESCGKPG